MFARIRSVGRPEPAETSGYSPRACVAGRAFLSAINSAIAEVCFWPKAAIHARHSDVRSQVLSGHAKRAASTSVIDPKQTLDVSRADVCS